jgi:hypothetical protein
MNLSPSQPNVEFFSTECYGGPKQYTDYPDGETSHAFSLIAELFAPKSRGEVTLKSKDAKDNPVVDHRYLSEELDVVVLSEACRFANEIITMGKGTKDIVEGSWPRSLTHHKYTSREDWVPFVRENATTCKFPLLFLFLFLSLSTLHCFTPSILLISMIRLSPRWNLQDGFVRRSNVGPGFRIESSWCEGTESS